MWIWRVAHARCPQRHAPLGELPHLLLPWRPLWRPPPPPTHTPRGASRVRGKQLLTAGGLHCVPPRNMSADLVRMHPPPTKALPAAGAPCATFLGRAPPGAPAASACGPDNPCIQHLGLCTTALPRTASSGVGLDADLRIQHCRGSSNKKARWSPRLRGATRDSHAGARLLSVVRRTQYSRLAPMITLGPTTTHNRRGRAPARAHGAPCAPQACGTSKRSNLSCGRRMPGFLLKIAASASRSGACDAALRRARACAWAMAATLCSEMEHCTDNPLNPERLNNTARKVRL